MRTFLRRLQPSARLEQRYRVPLMYSVVIPTYNRPADLYKCLDCLREYFEPSRSDQQPFEAEVIVSDDARQKDLQRYLSMHYPWARYVEGPSRGPAANRN